MKKVVITAIAVGGIALLAPLGLGFFIKHKYQQLYQLASDSNLPVTLKIIDYRQGWFTSNAIVQVTLEAPVSRATEQAPSKLQNYQFEIAEKIYHGPVIFQSEHPFDPTANKITFALALSDIIINQADLQLDVLTTLHYNGCSAIHFTCPRVAETINAERGWTFALQGLTGDLTINNAITHTTGDINLTSLDILMKENEQHFKKAHFSYNIDKDPLSLWHGERDLSIATLTFATQKNEQLEVQGVKLGLHDAQQNNKFSSTISASVADVKLDDNDFGSQQLIFSINDLDAQILHTLGIKAAEYDNNNASNEMMMLELYPLFLDLVNKGFSMHLSTLALNTSWGAINGKLNLSIAPSKTNIGNLEAILNNVSADAQIKFPVALLQDSLQMRYQSLTPTAPDPKTAANDDVKRWVLAGWLVQDNNNFTVKLNFTGNQLQINGKMLKIPLLPLPGIPATPQE